MKEVVNVILWAALIQGLLLAMIYIFSKKNRSFANFLLGMFLISLIFEALTTILPYEKIGSYSILSPFSLPEVKVFMPIFFMHFILEKLGSSYKHRIFLKVNYTIAILISSITLINLFLFIFFSTTLAKVSSSILLEKMHLWLQVYAFIIVICSFVISIKETIIYRNLVQNEYSDYKMLQINWLWRLIFMLLPAIILWGMELVSILITGRGWGDFVLITWGFVALFLYFLSYKAYRNQNLFEKLPESVLNQEHKTSNKPHTCNPENSKKIASIMLEQELFLNKDLTINTFAKGIDMSPRLISSCINQNFGYNFNEWVNNYRVEKAIAIIKFDTKNQLSIEGVGSDAGFKSRSAMYAAFKKKKGHSPGHYRGN